MKNPLRLLLFLFLAVGIFLPSHAQTLESSNRTIQLPGPTSYAPANTAGARMAAVTCAADSVQYGQAKATGLRGISLNQASSADKLGQYFDCPQTITISGFSLFSWQSDPISAAPVTLTCRVFLAGSDSLPTGTALGSATVVVDTNFYGGDLESLRKNATFTTPVVVNAPYVLVVETVSGNSVTVVCNDWAPATPPADGGMEWLGMASIATTGWLHGYELNVGGPNFDCDVLLQPVVTYDLVTDFTANPSCFSGNTTVTFTNTSSPIVFNRMYNIAAFVGSSDLSFAWDFGDGTLLNNVTDTTHTYTTTGSYTVVLSDTLFGWTSTCTDDTSMVIGNTPPATAFTASGSSLSYTFTDMTTGGPISFFWDFGDGNTSTLQNPSHNYAVSGTYTVCLTTTSSCGSDSSCMPLMVTNCQNPVTAFNSQSALLDVNFTDITTGTGTLAHLWDFGDGNSSTLQNPTHTYAAPGTYTVCLTVTDQCGSDSSCTSVTVTCPQPAAGFAFVTDDLEATFTNNSTAGTSYLWTFGDGNSDTATSPVHTYGATGSYQVCLITTNSCGSDTICDTVSVMISGLLDPFDGHVEVYPNPIQSQFQVSLSLQEVEDIKLGIYTLMGQAVYTEDLGAIKTANTLISTEGLENGIYLLRIEGSNRIYHQKIQILR